MILMLRLLLCIYAVNAFLLTGKQRLSKTSINYDYFKKNKDGEKKDVKRLWKNIIFPGIYFEYADTKEPLKTVKIETKEDAKPVRYAAADLSKDGTYNVADEKAVPQYSSAVPTAKRNIKPIQRPANFVKTPVPKKSIVVAPGKGVSVIPNIQSFKRPKQPIILYDYESDSACKLVRMVCSMLDLPIEFRPCPGALYGFSDQLSVLTLGERKVPYMVDNNPNMYRPRLFGAQDIVEHLFDTYGPGSSAIPASLKQQLAKAPSSGDNSSNNNKFGIASGLGGIFGTLGSSPSSGKGSRLRPNARPDNNVNIKPLTLYGWEGAPFVTPVRELLGELSNLCDCFLQRQRKVSVLKCALKL